MDISPRGIEFIVSFEGKHTLLPDGRYQAYLDRLAKPNVWTIWAGLTKGVHSGMCLTEDQCEAMFRKELAIYEDAVEKLVTVSLNQNQFDALVSFVYNCGPNALKTSTLLKRLNAGKYAEIPAQLARWNKAGGKVWPGLTRRRAAEGALFMEPMPVDEPEHIVVRVEGGRPVSLPETAMPQQVEESRAPVKDVVASSWTIRGAVAAIGGTLVQVYEWSLSGASEAGVEAVKLKTALGPWEALFAALKANMALLAAGLVLAGCAVVIARRIKGHQEGRT
jgi:lysozyme